MHPVLNAVWMCISFVALPIVMVHVIEYLSGHEIALLPSVQFALNVFWCQLVYALLFALTNHYRLSIIIGSIVCFLVGGVNYFVQLFRGSPFQLSDILAAGTAADVAGNYIIAINYELLLAGSITFLAISLAIVADFQRKRRDWKSIAASVVLLVYIVSSSLYFYNDKVWSKYNLKVEDWNLMLSYTNNGTMLSMAMGAKSMKAEKPEQYSKEAVQQTVQAVLDTDSANISQLGMDVKFLNTSGTAARYVPKQNKKPGTAISNPAGSVERPNIIAIMNESYADLHSLGDFSTVFPVMNYYKSLNKNTIKGNLSVSVLGGGTCNTEFEFLTGLNMAFLPSGVMAYSHYIKDDLESMATILQEQGYTPIAFHPGKASSWDRDKIYPNLGFETFYTVEDMDNPVYMRGAYVSDASDYDFVMKLFEEKDPDEKLFLFNVTIQNHGGYMLDTVGMKEWVAMRGDYRKYNQAEQYLSLMRASDLALKELITYFEQVDEPTMIVFFGDHQPNVETEFIEDLVGKPWISFDMDEVQSRYTVPFFIWCNYDIEEAYYDSISVNYLSTLAMEVAGVEMPAYNQYLSKLYGTLPAVNSLGYKDAEGVWHYFREENDLTPYLNGYELVQYDYLFGKKNRVDGLYCVDTTASE
ncbi:MAG: LTA synthase family protein, partial [Peptococcaceae bacterium]|nr:LTA synthase family protein [Peptococcaceae bacterium]